MKIGFNWKRAEEIGSRLGLHKDLPMIFMESDPQYQAVKDILDSLGLVHGMLYVIGVALISYMLSTRGEEHWSLAATYSKKGFPSGLVSFLESSKSTAVYRGAKRKRLDRYLREAVPQLKPLVEEKAEPDMLAKKLSHILHARSDSKTISFAAKMAYYVYRAAGVEVNPPSTPMPVDYRVCLVTITSGIAKTDIHPREAARLLRVSHAQKVRNAWEKVSSKAGIKPSLLDNIVWLTGRCVDENLGDDEATARCLRQRVPRSAEYMDTLRELWRAARFPVKS